MNTHHLPRQRPALVAWLLGAMGSMLAHSAAAQTASPSHKRSRTRTPGKPQPAGSKLARKAADKLIGIRNPGGIYSTAFRNR